jgi:F-type H+-transporting ATPase subunit a
MVQETHSIDPVQGVADTLQAAVGHVTTAEHGQKFEFSHLLEHVKDSREIEFPGGHFVLPQFQPVNIGGMHIDLSPTKHVFFLVLTAMILVVLAIVVARRYKKSLVPSGVANVFEALVLFVRDEIVLPNMGPGGSKYLPYLMTTFFFILLMNLIGLIPFGATATGNISVTAGLATISFVMIQVAAIRAQGLMHYLAHLTGGAPWYLWPIMIPIEVLGLFTKPFALTIRLFANMTGGHIVILSLLGLTFLFRSFAVGVGSVAFSVAISMLELMVAFIQAYVFTMLTSLFMGLGMQIEHQETAQAEHHKHS